MVLASKKMNSLMPKGSAPVNSLGSSNANTSTKAYGRSFTSGSGFSRTPHASKLNKEVTEKGITSTSSSVTIPVPSSAVFSAALHVSPEQGDNNNDLVLIDPPSSPSSLAAGNSVGKLRTVKKLVIVSENNNIDEVSDDCTQLCIKDEFVNIKNPNGYRMIIPYNKVRQFKIINKDISCGIIMFTIQPTQKRIKQVIKLVNTIVVYLKNPLPLKTSAQIARAFNVKLLKFTSAEVIRFSPLPQFEPIPADQFTQSRKYGSGKAFTDITNQMDTDFSSIDRRGRRGNSRGNFTYEELNDNDMDDLMIGENGKTKIYGYIPVNEQLYFEPNLKIKLDNKKTFTITDNEFRCLYNDNWVNDTIIDFVTAHHLEAAKAKNIPKTKNIEIMNSFFFTSLSRQVEDENYYKNVKSWFKKVDDLFDKDYIIIPINQDLHWYFVVISGLKKLKRRYIKREREESGVDTEDKETDETADAQDTVEDEAHTLVSLGGETANNSGNPIAQAFNMEQNNVDMRDNKNINDGDIIPVRQLISPLKNKRRIDDETGDFIQPDNRPPGTAQISVLNSLRKNHDKAIGLLRHFLIAYAKDKYNIDIQPQDIFKKICLVPQQKNLNDCGIHVLFNIETMLENPGEFDRTILKRPTGVKMRNRAKLENEKFFNKKRLLNYREELRNLLFSLLKKQVEETNGDSSQVGTKTVAQRLLEENSELSSDSLNGTKMDRNSTSTEKKDMDEEKGEDSDDDLVITHFREKTPVKEERTQSPKPKNRKPRNRIKIIGEVHKPGDDDVMDNDSEFDPNNEADVMKSTRLRKQNSKKEKTPEHTVKLLRKTNPKSLIRQRVEQTIHDKHARNKSLEANISKVDDRYEKDTQIGAVIRVPLLKSRLRGKSSELLSQDSFNGDNEAVDLLESDEDIDMVDENQPILENDKPSDQKATSSSESVSSSPTITSVNTTEILMNDIDKEIMTQDSERSESQQPTSSSENESYKAPEPVEISEPSTTLRRYRDSTIARISGSKRSLPIEIKDDNDRPLSKLGVKISSIKIGSISRLRSSGAIETKQMIIGPNAPKTKVDANESSTSDSSAGSLPRKEPPSVIFLKSESPESDDLIQKEADEKRPSNFVKAILPVVDPINQSIRIADKQEIVKRPDSTSLEDEEDAEFDDREHVMKVELQKIQLNNNMKLQKNLKQKRNAETNKELTSDKTLKDEVALYLDKSSNFPASPIKLQSESPKKNILLPLKPLDFESKEDASSSIKAHSNKTSLSSIEPVSYKRHTTTNHTSKNITTSSKPTNYVPLPLHITRKQNPREDLKPIAASLFSKSKSRGTTLISAPNITKRVMRSQSPNLDEVLASELTKTALFDTNLNKQKESGSKENISGDDLVQDERNQNSKNDSTRSSSNKRPRSGRWLGANNGGNFAFKKKTRSNYKVSDTEHQAHLYYDKYCGNIYDKSKSSKKQSSAGYKAHDVYSALRSDDDFKVTLADVPSSFDKDDSHMDGLDVEIVKSDEEDDFT